MTTPRIRRVTTAIALGLSITSLCGALVFSLPAQAQSPEGQDDQIEVEADDPDGVEDPVDDVDDPVVDVDEDDPMVQEGLPQDEEAVDREAVEAEDRRMMIVVGGLIATAVALILLTIRYWIVTRPSAHDADPGEVEQHSGAERRRFGRRSRRAIAGADHAGADADWQPRSTGEQRAVRAPDELRGQRPSRSVRSRSLSSDA